MWITTTKSDLTILRAMSVAARNEFAKSFMSKLDEIKSIDGDNGGRPVIGYYTPNSISDIPLSQSELIVKHSWNQEVNAKAFAEYFANFGWISGTAEEQN